LAARTHSYPAPSKGVSSDERRSNHRATLALLCGILSVIVIPLGIELTRKVTGAVLLDAAWAIPVAAVAAIAALLFERGARGASRRSLDRSGASRRLMAAHVFAVTGICLTLSSGLAVGVYEFLIWKENH
jgi:hypothetical protein